MKRFFAFLLSFTLLLPCMCGCSSDSTKVPDSQIELDMESVADVEAFFDSSDIYSFRPEFDRYDVAQHTCDSDMHTDTVLVDLYYSNWCAIFKYSVILVYQYSADSDLWTLISHERSYDSEGWAGCSEFDFSPDLPDMLTGRSAAGVKSNYYNSDFEAEVSIDNVDLNAGTITLGYCLDQYKQGTNVNHLFGKTEVELTPMILDGINYRIHFDYNECEGYIYITIREDSIEISRISIGD